MKTSDFDYHLPQALIAQTPAEPRDASRLLVLDRSTGRLTHKIFREIGEFFQAGDLLVANQTRVLPARLFGRKADSGGKIEVLLLRKIDELTWETLVGGKGMVEGRGLKIDSGPEGVIAGTLDGARRMVKFSQPIEPFLDAAGHVPLPPYIRQAVADPERYQTVFAREEGSAAAPTAGLHFTPELIASLEARGIYTAYVTLHVGLDTFAPVTEDDPFEHKIHTEWCSLPEDVASRINETKAAGGRVIGVGTTSVRTLESAAKLSGSEPVVKAFEGATDLFILPGYTFQVVDAMVTNFHLPKSTLMMMISAFAGREMVRSTYETAIRAQYRFYSFGDAMLIL